MELSEHRGEWDNRLFRTYPMFLLNIVAGAPLAIYIVAVFLSALESRPLLSCALSILGMTRMLAERIIKGPIENKVRKELALREGIRSVAFESEPRELPLIENDTGEKLAQSC